MVTMTDMLYKNITIVRDTKLIKNTAASAAHEEESQCDLKLVEIFSIFM